MKRLSFTQVTVTILIVVPIVFYAVKLSVALSGPIFWGVVAVAVAGSLAIVVRRRRADEAREAAWVGSFSFGDVVRRIRAEEALEAAADVRRHPSRMHLPAGVDTVVVPVIEPRT